MMLVLGLREQPSPEEIAGQIERAQVKAGISGVAHVRLVTGAAGIPGRP